MASIDYGSILKRSIELTRHHKWLWVYGLTLAIFSGSVSGNSNLGEIFKDVPDKIPKDLPEKTTYVLGQTTTLVREWFTAVPLTTWLFIGLGIVGLILLWLIFSWIIQSWAKGALIAGLDEADQNQTVNLISTSPRGIAKMKHLILFGLISTGLGIAATFVALLLTLIVVLVGSTVITQTAARVIWFGLWLLAIVLTGIFVMILFSMISVYAERLIVLKNFPPWQAWKKGLSLSKGHFLPTVVMGIINYAVGCTIGCLSSIALLVVLGIPGALLVLPHFKDGFRLPSLPVFGVLLVLILLFIYSNYLINALLTVFRFSNWSLFFKEVVSQENKV